MAKKVKISIDFDLFAKEYKEVAGLKKFGQVQVSKLLKRDKQGVCALQTGRNPVPKIVLDLMLMSELTGRSMEYFIAKKEVE